ncbi:peptide/nickel transport system permease protein [Devosia enhydra]|uniref:Peptide/nickel transport system permease protein n=1 Tax=Devosia enhydra TaxID=665118 RepID=A0A1K2HWH5_9HYPH|nr:ABC transporter permease [Devosia enhydra]SFZ83375.1 peptide/nickel transport system permease protein [Devosia enhydra]
MRDLFRALRRAPLAFISLIVVLIYVFAAIAPGLLAPYEVFDLTKISLMDSFIPPVWLDGGDWRFPLGTDDQGRDIISATIYGIRISLMVSIAGVILALLIGVVAGLVAGFFGGAFDAFLMRIADIQLTFPAILIAVLIDGVARAAVGQAARDQLSVIVLIIAIGLSGWVQYARSVRAATLVERERQYVKAARLIGISKLSIMFGHILPNVLTAVLVLATIHLATAIILEATLSFVGLGIPPTTPSLGTLISIGNGFLLSGEWWMAIFPGAVLALLVLCVNLLGDFLRDALNPRLR